MKCKGLILIMLMALFLGCAFFKKPIDNQDRLDFLNSMLRLKYPMPISQNKPLFIRTDFVKYFPGFDQNKYETVDQCADDLGNVDKEYPKTLEALKNYCELMINSPVEAVSSVGKLSVKHVFVGRIDSWESFYKQYPDAKGTGFIAFSPPGFSGDGSVAIVYLGQSAGSLSGHGGVEAFERVDGKWRTCDCGLWAGMWVASN